MQKISSHNNITILIDGKPHMFIGNADSSGVLYEFLSSCEDEERIKCAVNNISIQNYIKTYGLYPENKDIFDHGHEASYIALDQNYKAISVDDTEKRINVLNIFNILDIAVPLSHKDKDSALKLFNDSGQEASYLAVFCAKCLWMHSVENLSNGNISRFKKETIKHVSA